MSKDDIFIFLLAAILIGAMIFTFFFKGNTSKHGVGFIPQQNPEGTRNLIQHAC